METVGFSIRILGTDEQVKSIGLIEKELKKVSQERMTLNTQVKEATKNIALYNSDLKKERELYKSGAITQKEYERVTKSINQLKKSAQEALREEAQRLGEIRTKQNDLTIKRREAIKVINDENKINKISSGSYRDLDLQLGNLRNKYKALSEADRNSVRGQKLLGRIQKLDSNMKSLDATMGLHQRKVGDYALATQNLERKLSVLIAAQDRQIIQGKKSSATYKANSAAIRQTKAEIAKIRLAQQGYNETAGRGVLQNSKLASSFRGVAGAVGLTVGGGGLVVGALAVKKSIEVYADYEKVMDKVKAISGATDDEFRKLSDSARFLGESTQFTASEVGGLQVEYAKLGFTTDQILDATQATLDLALATDSDLAQSATVAGGTIRAFGLDISETSRVADVMTAAFNNTAFDITKFETSMRQVAPVAKAFGFTVEDTTALMGELVNANFDASQAGTATRNIILSLADSSSALSKRLKEPVKDMPSLLRGLNQLKEEGIDLAGAFELSDTRSVAAFSAFIQGTDSVNGLRKTLLDAKGAAAETARVMEDNLDGDTRKATSAISEMAISLGEKLSPKLREWVQGVTSTIPKVTKFFIENGRVMFNLVKALVLVGTTYAIYKTTLLVITALQSRHIALSVADATIQKISAGASLLAAAAKALLAGNTTRASIAMAKFNVITRLNPLGLVVTAILAGVVAFKLFNKATEEMTVKQQALVDVRKDAEKSIVSEKNQLKRLMDVAKDETRSKEDRQAAIEELNELSPEYLGNLNLENIATDEARRMTDAYTTALENNARQKAIIAKEDELAAKKLDIEAGKIEDTITWYDKLLLTEENQANRSNQLKRKGIEAIEEEEKALKELRKENELALATQDEKLKGDKGFSPNDPNGGKKPLTDDQKKVIEKNNNTILSLSKQLVDSELKLLEEGIDKKIKIEEEDARRRQKDIEDQKVSGNGDKARQINSLVNSLVENDKLESEQKIQKIVSDSSDDQLATHLKYLKEKEKLSNTDVSVLAKVQEEINKREEEALKNGTASKISELIRRGELEKEVIEQTDSTREDKDQKIREINLRTAEQKYSLLQKELELTDEVTDNQIAKLAELLDEIESLRVDTPSSGDPVNSFISDLFNVTDEEAERIKNRAVELSSQVYSSIVDLRAQQVEQELEAKKRQFERENDAELAALKKKLDLGLITQYQYDQKKESIAAATQRRIEVAEREARKKRQRAAVSQAVIDGALAITNIFSSYIYPANLVLAALQAVATGAQIATIKNQQFGDGGIIKGKSHSGGGVDINAEGGEAVINKRSMSSNKVMNLSGTPYQIASQINSMNGYGVSFPNSGGGHKMEFGGVVPSRPSNQSVGSAMPFDYSALASAIREGSQDKEVVFVTDKYDDRRASDEIIMRDSKWG